ncbi:hypothetical protein MMC07_007893 [Pseudocyphellaria aurata]|nr:hypothetical protein [Pseudocyphellaria aurata]
MAGPSFLDVFHRESRYPIFDRICSFLPIDSIVALTRTCRGLSELYRYLIPLQWNVDRLLSRFVSDPDRFRSQMGRHNALVSGSVALQFFERVLWKEADLDIYVEQGESAEAFAKYLTESEGYKLNSRKGGEYGQTDFRETRDYTKWSEMNGAHELRAQIIITWDLPLQTILCNFHSTLVMNFFTWNKAYAIFPLPTFVHHKGYLLKPLENYLSTLLEKYSRRGWRIQGQMWPEESRSNHPIQTNRRIGDKFSWMIPFDTLNVDWSKTPDSALEYSTFGVDTIPNDPARSYRIQVDTFDAGVLRHRYLFNSWNWMMFLGERVDALTILELYKLPPALRPAAFRGALSDTDRRDRVGLYRAMIDFQKPPGWTYWDDEVPTWYQAWEQAEAESKKESHV